MRVAFMTRETNETYSIYSYQLMPPVGSTSLDLIHSRRVFGCLRNKLVCGIKSGDYQLIAVTCSSCANLTSNIVPRIDACIILQFILY